MNAWMLTKGDHLDIVEKLLAAVSEVNTLHSKINGYTALQAATDKAYLNIVEKLLAAGSDVDTLPSKNYSSTALQVSVKEGS